MCGRYSTTLEGEMFSGSAPSGFLEPKTTMDVERKWPKLADINLQILKDIMPSEWYIDVAAI